MKKMMFVWVIVAGFMLATQQTQAQNQGQDTTQVQTVTPADYQKMEVKDLPKAVADAVANEYPQSMLKEASVANAEEAKKYKIIITTKDQEEKTLYVNEKGEFAKE